MILSPALTLLASQARAYAYNQSTTNEHHCVVGSDYFLDLERAKFAELIVKECAKIAEAYEPDEKLDDITYASQVIRALISG